MAIVILVAIIGGTAVSLQGQLVGVLDEKVGTAGSVLATYGVGGALALVSAPLFRSGRPWPWREVPWWVYLAGLLGLVIIGTIAFAVARIGLVRAMTVITVVQFTVSAVIDHFGLLQAPVRPVDVGRSAGIALMVAGTWLVMR